MFELDDAGKEVHIKVRSLYTDVSVDLNINMVIKAPGGIMVLFDHNYISPDTQCEAIKAFMKEHRDD